jgi:hypothetical protein
MLNAHGGSTPAAVAPPNAITPEQVQEAMGCIQVTQHHDSGVGATRLNAHGVPPPPLWLPPNAITQNRYYITIALSVEGGEGGQALSPQSSNQYCVFYFNVKEILRCLFILIPVTGHDGGQGSPGSPGCSHEKSRVIDLSSVPFPYDMGPAGRSEIIRFISTGIPYSVAIRVQIPDPVLVYTYLRCQAGGSTCRECNVVIP